MSIIAESKNRNYGTFSTGVFPREELGQRLAEKKEARIQASLQDLNQAILDFQKNPTSPLKERMIGKIQKINEFSLGSMDAACVALVRLEKVKNTLDPDLQPSYMLLHKKMRESFYPELADTARTGRLSEHAARFIPLVAKDK